MVDYPAKVRIVEVGPRDGLQNEPATVSTTQKIELIERLADCGLTAIEATAFVAPKWVPRMADHAQVLRGVRRRAGVRYPVLVPNLRGLEGALAAGADEVAVFPAASESFSQRNLNCSIAESIERIGPVAERALAENVRVRGYISCVLGCPYEGRVEPGAVAELAARLRDLGCYELSLGDTIGTGTPAAACRMVEAVAREVPVERLAGHFHDTYGQALANMLAVMQMGVAVFDASVAGLGGCPYARGATGNVATEDVLYMLHGMGVETGVDLEAVIDTAWFIAGILGRPPGGHVSRTRGAPPGTVHSDSDRS